MGMRTRLAFSAAVALAMTGGVAAPTAMAAPTAAGPSAAPMVREGICTAPARYTALAARLSRDIKAALAGRHDYYSLTVFDRTREVACALNENAHFHSASVVKATILAALLRWHQETGRPLTANEKYLATLMITQSDNDAATALWNEVGQTRLQHFLDLANMSQTVLNPGAWGLTEITAHDELTLLRTLTYPNPVLSNYSRGYELGLMAQVIASQRWGTPAGAPAGLTVHVKNGWLPETVGGWKVHSIGSFNGHGRDYMMAVLTENNPTMAYGVDTIEAVAKVVHRDLNAGLPSAGAPLPAIPAPAHPSPDEVLPASPPASR
jgi:beta-lactamase class A